MAAKKKWMVFPLITAICGATFFSFYAAHTAVVGVLNRGRASKYSDLETGTLYQVRKTWKDYPALQTREEFEFKQEKDLHHAYFYEASSPKGLIFLAHGYQTMADGHEAALADYFLQDGWSVLQIDMIASGKDDDKSMEGFEDGPRCVKESLDYIQSQERFSQYWDKICLMGYSWGGYSVTAALSEDYAYTPKAVVSFAGFNVPANVMVSLAKRRVGGWLEMMRPLFYLGMMQTHGEAAFESAVAGINHAPECEVMLIQGSKDEHVPVESASIWAKADQITNQDRLTLYNGELLERDHLSIWYDEASNACYEDAKDEYRSLVKEYGSRKEIPEEKLDALKEKTSVVDEEMLSSISDLFEKAVA